uniref:Uncharacterized protein n=1 Tax=Anguilla anguilla TaxID=7936 RepID=A0A0E9T2H9_ANGAN
MKMKITQCKERSTPFDTMNTRERAQNTSSTTQTSRFTGTDLPTMTKDSFRQAHVRPRSFCV